MYRRTCLGLGMLVLLVGALLQPVLAEEQMNPGYPETMEAPAQAASPEAPAAEPPAEVEEPAPAQEPTEAAPPPEEAEPEQAAEQPAATGLTATKMVICTSVEDRTPVGEGTSFSGSVGKLHCFSVIEGAKEETTVHHIWYRGDQKMADIPLAVRSSHFRTHSSKTILPEWTGAWRVELVTDAGEVLAKADFTIE